MLTKIRYSFYYAYNGFRYTLKNELNFRIELLLTLIVCTCGYLFSISKLQWFIILLNIVIVLAAELFNTAIEKLCNMLHSQPHPTIKIIKDVSAAAVVTAALSAFICGTIIFLPIFIKLI